MSYIFTLIKTKLFQALGKSPDDAYLIKNSGGAFVVQIGSIGLVFLSSWLLTRLIGVDQYGVYTYIFSWITLFAGFAAVGFDDLLVRNMAIYQARKEAHFSKGNFRLAIGVVLAASLLLMGVLYLFLNGEITSHWLISEKQLAVEPRYKTLFYTALLALPFIALLSIFQASLVGLKQIVTGQIAEKLVKPGVLVFGLCIAYFVTDNQVNAHWAIGLSVVASVVALGVCMVLFLKKAAPFFKNVQATYRSKLWAGSAASFLLLTGVNLINIKTDVLMLGTLAEAGDVGVYNIAAKLSELLRFVLVMVNAVMAPLIANLYAEGKLDDLQKMVTKSTRLIVVLSLPFALAFLVLGKWLLSLFGSEFMIAYLPLLILSGGQLLNLLTGSGANILVMTGHERLAFVALGVSTVANIILNAWFIPQWGAIGAAWATAISVAVYKVLLLWFPLWKLGIDPTVWGKRKG